MAHQHSQEARRPVVPSRLDIIPFYLIVLLWRRRRRLATEIAVRKLDHGTTPHTPNRSRSAT